MTNVKLLVFGIMMFDTGVLGMAAAGLSGQVSAITAAMCVLTLAIGSAFLLLSKE